MARTPSVAPADLHAEYEQLQEELACLKDLNAEMAEELGKLRYLKSRNRLLKVDYGYNPKSRDWKNAPFIRQLTDKLKSGEDTYIVQVKNYARYIPQLKKIPLDEKDCVSPTQPFWLNNWIPGFDAISLYATVAEKNPRYYLEIGSGNSTKFVSQAIRDHNLRTKIISIDPSPRAEINDICAEIIRQPCEDIDLAIFDRLTAEDMVFVDNSHISFMNTDVTVFFCEILGMLPAGLVYGLHDIHLPLDYPAVWVDRWYNEQYLLMMYLAGGAQGDKIVLPNYYMSCFHDLRELLADFYKTPPFDAVASIGGIFWMERGGNKS